MPALRVLAVCCLAISLWLVLSAFALERELARVAERDGPIAVVPRPTLRFIRPPFLLLERQAVAVTVWVDPHPDNRRLVFAAADDLSEVTLTERPMNGDKAQKAWRFDLKEGLPAGDWILVAALYGLSGKETARATSPVQVRSLVGP